jgi:CheY-like chemotaxis protein
MGWGLGTAIRERPALILSDVNMPRMERLEAAVDDPPHSPPIQRST